ncbi:AraC family transcriptional regulator [Pseudomonas syringae pv. coryli]|uniref:Transcriptional regulator, AraC family n=1 Tax=Pseudomonas syringae pv. coryli TaxID=317659 RepID=A0A0P9Q2Z7_9PSED|nr:AraC family transcriptional regulator [Pseudomonas syringae pv. coryli]KPW91981.1 Transcriptional regulator, AraC family [Pseudomonas syringae pv. coryli]
MTPGIFDANNIHFDLGPDAGGNWSEVMLEHHGLYCEFDKTLSGNSTAQSWSLGAIGVTQADLKSLVLIPVGEKRDCWQGEWLYLKLMTGGYVDIDEAGKQHRFMAGSMFFIDPGQSFQESFTQHGQMTVLRIPKSSLRDRGLRHSLPGLMVADMESADIRAARDLIHCIAQQQAAPGLVIRELMGRQLLELIDAMLGGPGDKAVSRSTDVVLLRARRYIYTRLSDTELDCAAIAGAVHVSVKHLQRLFRSQETTVMRDVWNIRLQHAQQLLSSTRTLRPSVQDVAWQCGFTTAAHFSRAYRAQFGICPSHVRATLN